MSDFGPVLTGAEYQYFSILPSGVPYGEGHTDVEEGGKRTQRKRAGPRQLKLMEKRSYKMCFPSLVMGNGGSLANKMKECHGAGQESVGVRGV